MSYRIFEVRPPNDEDVAEFDDLFIQPAPSDVVVGLGYRIFNAGGSGARWRTPPVDERTRYLLRQQGDKWIALGRYTARLDLPPKTRPDDMRTLGDAPATSTSSCIGKLENQVCAAETAFAGIEWQNPALIAFAKGTGTIPPEPWDKRGYRLKIHYRVLESRAVRQEDIARLRNLRSAPGDVIVDVDDRCVQRPCAKPREGITSFVVRQSPTGWQVIGWGNPLQ